MKIPKGKKEIEWELAVEDAVRGGASLSEAALIANVPLSRVLAKARNDEEWADRLRAAFFESAELRFKNAETILERLASEGNVKAAIAIFEHRLQERQRAASKLLPFLETPVNQITITPLGPVKQTKALPETQD